MARNLTVVSTRLVAAEWPSLDEARCRAIGLTIMEETEQQLADIASGLPGLSLADRSALTVARDGGFTLVTNDVALHRMAGSAGVPRVWGAELLPPLVGEGHLEHALAVRHIRTMRTGKAGSEPRR